MQLIIRLIYIVTRRMFSAHPPFGQGRQTSQPGRLTIAAVTAAYALPGNWGSIEYGSCGDLPHAFGHFLLLAFVAGLLEPELFWLRGITGGCCWRRYRWRTPM